MLAASKVVKQKRSGVKLIRKTPYTSTLPQVPSSGAYLLAHFDVTGSKPVFASLGFYSSPYVTQSSKQRLFLVAEEVLVEGRSYGEALETLKRHVYHEPWYAWCLPFLPAEDQHDV
jgi:hypothetical protein